MKRELSRDQILTIASTKEFYVHKYSWGQSKLRKKCRRMLKDGLLKLVKTDNENFIYRKMEVIEKS